jgi:hypothetical protein
MTRTQFYDYKRRFELQGLEGLEGLKDLPPIHKSHQEPSANDFARGRRAHRGAEHGPSRLGLCAPQRAP